MINHNDIAAAADDLAFSRIDRSLEDRTYDALARVAVAMASRDTEAVKAAHARLWDVGSRLCRDRRGESLAAVLEFEHDVVSSSRALVHAINYFACINARKVRARMTPFAS